MSESVRPARADAVRQRLPVADADGWATHRSGRDLCRAEWGLDSEAGLRLRPIVSGSRMSVIASVSVPAEGSTIGRTLLATLEVRMRLERVVRVEERPLLYVWVSDEDVDHVDTAFHHTEAIEAVTVIDQAEGHALIRVEWAEGASGFFEAMEAAGGTVLEGTGRSDAWRFRIRFEGHKRLTAFYRACAERGVDLDIEDVHGPRSARDLGVEFELTETQRETLRMALERGHFAVPRETSLADLGEEIGVSDTAVSERLRRGIATLLSTTIEESDREKPLG